MYRTNILAIQGGGGQGYRTNIGDPEGVGGVLTPTSEWNISCFGQ